ncbi:MAG: hypothetical protein ACE5EH_03115 [Gammaproteobacteria bacterium]
MKIKKKFGASRKACAGLSYPVVLLGLLGLVVVVITVLLAYTVVQLKDNIRLNDLLNEERVLVEKIGYDVNLISNLDLNGFALLEQDLDRLGGLFNEIKQSVNTGDHGGDIVSAMNQLESEWFRLRNDLTGLASHQPSLAEIYQIVEGIRGVVADIKTELGSIERDMANIELSASDAFLLAQQSTLIQRLSYNVEQLVFGGNHTDRLSVYERIGSDSAVFEQTLQDFIKGDKLTGKNGGGAARVRESLLKINKHFVDISGRINGLIGVEQDLIDMIAQSRGVSVLLAVFSETSATLSHAYSAYLQNNTTSMRAGYILSSMAILFITMLGFQLKLILRNEFINAEHAESSTLAAFVVGELERIKSGDYRQISSASAQIPSQIVDAFNHFLSGIEGQKSSADNVTTGVAKLAQDIKVTVLRTVGVADKLADQIDCLNSHNDVLTTGISRISTELPRMKDLIKELTDSEASFPAAFSQIKAESDALCEAVSDASREIENLAGSMGNIGVVTDRVQAAGNQINLLSLNAAIEIGHSKKEVELILSAEEIQRSAERILSDVDELNSLVTTVQSQVEHISLNIDQHRDRFMESVTLDNDISGDASGSGKITNEFEKQFYGLVKNIKEQIDANKMMTDELANVQQSVVAASAEINAMMAQLDALVKASVNGGGSIGRSGAGTERSPDKMDKANLH